MSRKDYRRIADGFRYVVNDPTADPGTVAKMLNEFCNAAAALNPNFNRGQFMLAATRPD